MHLVLVGRERERCCYPRLATAISQSRVFPQTPRQAFGTVQKKVITCRTHSHSQKRKTNQTKPAGDRRNRHMQCIRRGRGDEKHMVFECSALQHTYSGQVFRSFCWAQYDAIFYISDHGNQRSIIRLSGVPGLQHAVTQPAGSRLDLDYRLDSI